jgi:hypothetical protein
MAQSRELGLSFRYSGALEPADLNCGTSIITLDEVLVGWQALHRGMAPGFRSMLDLPALHLNARKDFLLASLQDFRIFRLRAVG